MNFTKTEILDFFFPPRCAFCRKLVETGEIHVCDACRPKLPYTRPGDVQKKDFIKTCVAPFYYEKEVRSALLRYKFGQKPGYAAAFAEFVAVRIREDLKDEWDLLTWVPVSRLRLRQRGYDQAELLCSAVGKELGVEPMRLLVKQRHTKAQSATGSAEKRRANISGAYRICDNVDVKDKRILLIDDIITTGSTLSECARTLGIAGAASVVCATAARQRD